MPRPLSLQQACDAPTHEAELKWAEKVKVLKMAVEEDLEGGICPGEGCPEPLKVPITLTYVLYTEGERLATSSRPPSRGS